MKQSFRITGVAALGLLIAGCVSGPTPYQPISSANRVAGGYSEVRLTPNSYRVTFAGNNLTSRERVEVLLLYRAAELTLQQHHDWFVMEDREVDRHVQSEVSPDPRYRPAFYDHYASWRPYWRYYGPTTGWRTWDPYGGTPFWSEHVRTSTVEHFEVSAEIRMDDGAISSTNQKAFDARDVIARLGPEVVRTK